MIGVQIKLGSPQREYALNEFFEIFKTSWGYYQPAKVYDALLLDTWEGSIGEIPKVFILTSPGDWQGFVARAHKEISDKYSYFLGEYRGKPALKFSFDLFEVVFDLLHKGLNEEQAEEPILDLIIQSLKEFLAIHITFVEIVPKPWGFSYSVALTHDVDHLSLKEHLKTRAFYGRVRYGLRSVLKNYLGSPFGLKDEWRTWGEVGMQLLNSGIAALRVVFPSLKDPWTSFDRVIRMEDRHEAESSSFYFAQKPGRGIVYQNTSEEYLKITQFVEQNHREIGVHTMDGWSDLTEAKQEWTALHPLNLNAKFGTRVHWLYFQENTWSILAETGYYYDTTFGFNKTVGFRAGLAQAYKPYKADIWELPLHIQDGALFRRTYLALKPKEATLKALATMKKSADMEGVSTLLWHVKSLSTEYTTWAQTYEALLTKAHEDHAWITSGREIVRWFSARRRATFVEENGLLKVSFSSPETKDQVSSPYPLRSLHVRYHSPQGRREFELKEGSNLEFGLSRING